MSEWNCFALSIKTSLRRPGRRKTIVHVHVCFLHFPELPDVPRLLTAVPSRELPQPAGRLSLLEASLVILCLRMLSFPINS